VSGSKVAALLALVAAVGLFGCARMARRAAPVPPSLGAASADSLLGRIEDRAEEIRSLRAVAKVRIQFEPEPGEDEGESFSTTQAVLAAAPASFRLDSLSPFGVSYAAVSDGQSLAVLTPEEGTIYRGRATPRSVSSATGVEASPADVARLLLGQVPMPRVQDRLAWVSAAPGNASVGGTREVPPQVYLHVPSADVAGETIVVGFSRPAGGNGEALPVVFERIDAQGDVRFRADFAEHRAFGEHVVPTRIDVKAPRSGATLTYRDVELNPELEPRSFHLATPPGMRDLPLEARADP